MSESDRWLLIYGREKGKISGCFKSNISIVLQKCRNKVSFQRKGSSVVLNFCQIFKRLGSVVYS